MLTISLSPKQTLLTRHRRPDANLSHKWHYYVGWQNMMPSTMQSPWNLSFSAENPAANNVLRVQQGKV